MSRLVPFFGDPTVHQLSPPTSLKNMKEIVKNLEKSSQDGPRGRQDGAKTLPRGLQEAPKRAKNVEKATKTPRLQTKNLLCQCPPPSWDTIWTPKAPQERPKSLPKAPKMECQTRKNRCLKTSRFQTRFFHGLGVIFKGFFNDFLKAKIGKFAKSNFCKKLKNGGFP